jgi:hypothetical protein
MDAGESSGLRTGRRSSRSRRLGERRCPWTICRNPENTRICEEPGACPLPPAKEIIVVAERVYGIPNSPQDQAPCPCVLLHPDRGNERSARLARYVGDTKTSSADFTQELKTPTFAGLHVGPLDVRAPAKSRGYLLGPIPRKIQTPSYRMCYTHGYKKVCSIEQTKIECFATLPDL